MTPKRKEKPNIALIYCRSNRPIEDRRSRSIENQQRECLRFAESKGYKVDSIYVDFHRSVETKYLGLDRMIDAIEEIGGSRTEILILRYSVISRDVHEYAQIERRIALLGSRIRSITTKNRRANKSAVRYLASVFEEYCSHRRPMDESAGKF
jgi:DNA invertase Pin-like site-specific DNA recombinase